MEQDLNPTQDIKDSRYFNEEGYIKNDAPRDVKLFLAFERATQSSNTHSVIVLALELEEASAYYQALQGENKKLLAMVDKAREEKHGYLNI